MNTPAVTRVEEWSLRLANTGVGAAIAAGNLENGRPI